MADTKIVVIDVGSEIKYSHKCCVVKIKNINLRIGVVEYNDLTKGVFNNLCEIAPNIESINGIPVNEIEEVRIAGYNDKVTLRVGDTLSIRKSENPPHIVKFKKNGWIFSSLQDYYNIDIFEDWYVNGKKYYRDDIILPNQVVQSYDEIDHIPDVTKMVEITPENIEEVLEYNNIDNVQFGTGVSGKVRFFIRHKSISRDVLSCDFECKHWLSVLEAYLGYKLKPLPKQPKNLMEWWEKNKVEGFKLIEQQGSYFTLSNRNYIVSLIFKGWNLPRQIDAVQKLIEIYKD